MTNQMEEQRDLQELKDLLLVETTLHSEEGCPWDRMQTFHSVRSCVLEEAHEVLEALDEGDPEKLAEELGDLLHVVLFFAKVGEREGLFRIADLARKVREKLVHRHPHVFGDEKGKSIREIEKTWEAKKKQEKAHANRTSAMDGIPKNLPALMRAQKMVKRVSSQAPEMPLGGEGLVQKLLELVKEAATKEVDLEGELQRALVDLEARFRAKEERLQEEQNLR